MTTGTAILSLDCEGKWGIADHLTPQDHAGLTDARIRWAYDEMTAILRRHEVAVTYAVVELFAMSPDEQRAAGIAELAEEMPYLADAARGILADEDGWSGPWVLDLLQPGDELAFHGYTHVPWTDLTPEQARRELARTPEDRRRTMVFPRNRIAHLDILAEFGCAGFRGAAPGKSRVVSLLSEFDVTTPSEVSARHQGGLIEIPPGIFINWRRSARRLVPPQVTRLRARNLLAHAARTGGVAHFWIHPENVASHQGTLANFDAVVEEMARARSEGGVEVRTQVEYCRAVESGTSQ